MTRPRAWGVLAVALALMALVVALSSAGGRRSARTTIRDAAPGAAHHGRGSRSELHRASPVAGAAGRRGPRLPDLTAGLTLAGAGRRATAVAAAGAATPSWPASRPGAAAAAGAAPAGAAAVGSSTPPAPTGSEGSATARPGGTTGTYPGHGRIAAPTTSVSYPAEGGGTVTAEATWTGAPTLDLSISCPGGVSVARAGPSGLSAELDDGGGSAPCEVTLGLPPGSGGDATFTLTIEPGP